MLPDEPVDVMVVGGGGREHAICAKLAESNRVQTVFCAPGNGGTANCTKVKNVDLKVDDFSGIARFAEENKVELVVIGPDNPLADGIVDYLQGSGLRVFGPRKEAARLESSKAFAKDFMVKNGIPTARYFVADSHRQALELVEEHDYLRVVKVDGLALGKGVFVCKNKDEVIFALKQIFRENRFGKSNQKVVLEERLVGEEISLLMFCDGRNLSLMPACQDHKRRFDGDRGPNTGGMGVYAPVDLYARCREAIHADLVKPLQKALDSRSLDFKGIIFAGLLMVRQDNNDKIEENSKGNNSDGASLANSLTAEGTGSAGGSPASSTENGKNSAKPSSKYRPYVLEFNARFGDPETQAIMPLLKSDLFEIFWACTECRLASLQPEWSSQSSCCVIACAKNYPEGSSQGQQIEISSLPDETTVFHAGTKLKNGQLVSAGGRVLGVTGVGTSLTQAIDRAYEGIQSVSFSDMDYRKDIGRRALVGCP